jgi:hypothetical protein
MMLTGWMFLVLTGTSLAESLAREDYLNDCAECHDAEGKAADAAKRMLRGGRSADLTFSKANEGQFPRQQVHDAIDGRYRVAAQFLRGRCRNGQCSIGLTRRSRIPRWKRRNSGRKRTPAMVLSGIQGQHLRDPRWLAPGRKGGLSLISA